MADKKKDRNGRILRKGELQRKDGRYQYKYKQKAMYAKTLSELRQGEEEWRRRVDSEENYSCGEVTLAELVERYISLKADRRYGTVKTYNFVLDVVKQDGIGQRKVKELKVSDIKRWIVRLKTDRGFKYNTMYSIRSVVKPALEMAIDDDIIHKNPFKFPLDDVIQKDADERVALTAQQKASLLDYIQQSKRYNYLYNEVNILLETGLRVSELYGLTLQDVDLENARIRINKQLQKKEDGTKYISPPKSKSGVRCIPLNPRAATSLEDAIRNRTSPKSEEVIDGVSGFVFLNRKGRAKTASNLQDSLYNCLKRYNEEHEDALRISPHVFRHTFITEVSRAGLSAKYVQVLAGHSNISTTLNIYTHVTYEDVADAYFKLDCAQ